MQRQPRVDDVLDEEDVTTLERRVGVLEQAHATIPPVRVRRELDYVEGVWDPKSAGEVGEKDDARLQRRDEHGIEARVLAADLRAKLGDACGDLVARQMDGAQLAVLGSLRDRHQDARRSR
jgi:hypothetical protein